MWNVWEKAWVRQHRHSLSFLLCRQQRQYQRKRRKRMREKKNGDRCSNHISIMLIIRFLLFYTACMEHMEHYCSTLFTAQYNQNKSLPNSQTRRIFSVWNMNMDVRVSVWLLFRLQKKSMSKSISTADVCSTIYDYCFDF